MVYLEQFRFPDAEVEFDFFLRQKRTCYDTYYPFQILSKHRFEQIDFEPVTILYGGNGTGKSTVLNIIAQKLHLLREAPFNQSSFYEDYLELCSFESAAHLPKDSRIITSDDVFDYMLNIRNLNEGIDRKREMLFEEYLDTKFAKFRMKSLDDYEQLKRVNNARRKTQSQFIRSELMDNVREPENSLSPAKQQELVKFIEDSARFFGCQFVIATHSPFVLAIRGAKIYDLDEEPVDVKRWTELENVRAYYDFFKKHASEF